MKQFFLSLIFFVGFFSISASNLFGAEWVPTETDRVEINPGQYGLLYSDNFEYVCLFEIEGNQNLKSYLDLDYVDNKGNRSYRFAFGFIGGGFHNGIFAIEEKILSASRARGLQFNLTLTLSSGPEFDQTYTLVFKGDASAELLTVTLKGNPDRVVASCKKAM